MNAKGKRINAKGKRRLSSDFMLFSFINKMDGSVENVVGRGD